MPVTSSATPLLFCEGKPNSLDYLLLQRLATGPVQICPVGGKYALNAFMEGRLSSFGDHPPAFLGVRDRDFDVEPPEAPSLIELSGEKPLWMTHRACIESYFLDPELLHQYWSFCATGPQWKYGPPPSIQELGTQIEAAARAIANYQAVRWALAQLKPGRRWPEVQTTWRKGSGDLPLDLDRPACQQAGRELVRGFTAATALVTEERFDEQEEHFHTLFHEPDFFQQQRYLVWFHGKDLLTALRRQLNFSQPEMADYCTWAAQNLNLATHPDLQELQVKIEALS